jgi:hypothetical protein
MSHRAPASDFANFKTDQLGNGSAMPVDLLDEPM